MLFRSLKALSNPVRMRILGLLRNGGKRTVGQISAQTGIAPGSASYHLQKLEEAGLVRRADRGKGDHRQSWWETSPAVIEPDLDEGETSGLETEVAIRRASAQSYADAYGRYLGNYGTIPTVSFLVIPYFEIILAATTEARYIEDRKSVV